jgi:hypothetical protein
MSGWHGMDVVSVEVDYNLIVELTPDGSAVKVGVVPGSAAAKAGVRTGDYVLGLGQEKLVSLSAFDELGLQVGDGVLVRFHRPGVHRRGEHQIAALTLRRRPGCAKLPPWKAHPRVAFGPCVERDERKEFLGEMAGHPYLTDGCVRYLVRLLNYYQGPLGICPSYRTVAKKLRRSRRTVMRHADRLEWFGIVEVLVGAGLQTEKGPTNQFVVHWPEGWVRERFARRKQE